jgi:cytochrome c oxidase accessory protein FixG
MERDGSRRVLHPVDVRGTWMKLRRMAFALLVTLYIVAPFIEVRGHPAIHLDIVHRRFFLFGATYNAQDFWLVLFVVLTFAFGLLHNTAWRGRVWCAWACPQTVFLEGVIRPIERLIDGPRERRLKLQSSPWTPRKLARRGLKLLLYLAVATLIAHTAAAIFVSPHELMLMLVEGPSNHMGAFGLTLGFTAVLTFNFAWFREQFCVVLCPYGRLQSVLHDRHSVTIAYLEARGDPRGKLVKKPPPGAPKLGDCINCKRCVLACPTGIDIRNGLQMDCLACHQCIDACDEVMTKIGRPTGLISFRSLEELAGRPRKFLRRRLFAYAGLMLVCLAVLGVALTQRTPFEANVVRPSGSSPFTIEGTGVRNSFTVHLVNKNPTRTRFHLGLKASAPARISVPASEIELESLSDQRVPVTLIVDKQNLGTPVELLLEVHDLDNEVSRVQKVRFLAPAGFGTASP